MENASRLREGSTRKRDAKKRGAEVTPPLVGFLLIQLRVYQTLCRQCCLDLLSQDLSSEGS